MSIRQSDTPRTPPKLFKELDSVFNFFWDACCDKDNCLIKSQIPLITDFDKYNYLSYNWNPQQLDLYKEYSIFMNPPYSNPGPFIKKAWEDSKHFRVVMLLKADMSTNWFNDVLDQLNHTDDRGFHPVQIRQNNMTITDAVLYTLSEMDLWRYNGVSYDTNPVGILHLRKRIKFYVSEEVFLADTNAKLKNGKIFDDIYTYKPKEGTLRFDTYLPSYEEEIDQLMETKNYRRVEDGIESKSCANFPSMMMVFNRTNEFKSKK